MRKASEVGMVEEEDMYIRMLAKVSTIIPEKQKRRIVDRFVPEQLITENRRYYCPHCKMQTPKMSNYCCNCGQKVTLENPVMAVLN